MPLTKIKPCWNSNAWLFLIVSFGLVSCMPQPPIPNWYSHSITFTTSMHLAPKPSTDLLSWSSTPKHPADLHSGPGNYTPVTSKPVFSKPKLSSLLNPFYFLSLFQLSALPSFPGHTCTLFIHLFNKQFWSFTLKCFCYWAKKTWSLFLSLFIYFEREWEQKRGRERGAKSQAGSTLSARSQTGGSSSPNMRSWPEPKSSQLLSLLGHPGASRSLFLRGA